MKHKGAYMVFMLSLSVFGEPIIFTTLNAIELCRWAPSSSIEILEVAARFRQVFKKYLAVAVGMPG
jgi:hypothetical protein